MSGSPGVSLLSSISGHVDDTPPQLRSKLRGTPTGPNTSDDETQQTSPQLQTPLTPEVSKKPTPKSKPSYSIADSFKRQHLATKVGFGFLACAGIFMLMPPTAIAIIALGLTYHNLMAASASIGLLLCIGGFYAGKSGPESADNGNANDTGRAPEKLNL